MKTLRIAALAVAVSGVFTLGAKAGTDTNNWWDVTFDDKLGLCDLENQTVGPDGAMVVLTNQFKQGDGATVSVQTWDSGIWYTQDGDETIVTNSYNPTNTYKAYGSDLCLKLDTQGNDLTWRVDPTNTMADSRTALVDADLYLVGSDSPPDAGDFDAAEDVQTAVYLKNETDEDTGETTNSVLCVYAYDSDAKANYWQELKGVKVEDNSWASVKVVVDHAKVIDPQNPYPVVQVFVNGVKMTARDGDTDHWTAANSDAAQTAGRVSSVAFRGTGAVDNFVGKYVETTYDTYDFTAEVYMNGTLVAEGTEGNVTRILPDVEAGAGKVAKFESFMYHNFVDVDNPATYSLSRIEIVDLASGETTTLRYGYNRATAQIILPENHPDDIVDFATDFAEDDEGQEYEYFTGPFTVNAPTVGATKDDTIVYIYFESLPEEGQFKLTATQNVGTAPADQTFNVNDENLPAFATFTFAESISAGGTSYILSKIKPGTAPADPITLKYESPNAVVKVPLSDEITGTQYEVATATYVEGTLGDRVLGYEWDATNGEWSFTAKNKPVAIIVAGNVTNEYSSLRAAIEASAAGDTITLVADDHVSFSAESTEIAIGKSLTIDGGSNTLYGVSGYAYDGVNDHDIFIGAAAGDVTIKDLRITEFSDTAPTVQYRTYPIWTSQGYAGKLTLDGVQIDKFARTAINLGNGTFEITNCVITGYAGATGAPENYFQNAITLLDAKGTVAETTVTGIGTHEGSKWGAGLVTFNKDGDGEVTFLSGSYTADFVIEVSSNATGKVVISNGTFVATAPAEDEGEAVSAFQFDEEAADRTLTVTIAGGWFDREPEAEFIAAGLAAKEVAPGTAAPWTVGQTFTITFNDEDGSELYKTNGVFTGETGYGPATDPTKAETDAATYAFAGWTNAVAGGAAVATADLPAADADATWTAVYAATPKHYLVTFLNGEETFSTTNAAYGETGYGPATDPTKAETAQYSYAFAGWTNAVAGGAAVATADLPPVEGEATWTAVFSETVKTYDVEWIVDGTYTTNTWAYNATPSWNENDATAEPTKASTAATNFTFAGWSPAVAAVTGPGASYTATWTETVRQYWILWNVDGTVTSNQVAYGETPAYPGEAPSKEGYAFLGWNSDPTATTALANLPAVEDTATYYAVFEEESADPDPVDPGDSLTAADKTNGNLPIEVTDAGFVVKFRSKQPGVTYQLVYSTSLTVADWTACSTAGDPVTSAATTSDENTELITLTAPMGDDPVKFFKIKATK